MRSFGALYVHIPFCARKCLYCDFPSTAVAPGCDQMEALVRSHLRTIDELAAHGLLDACQTAYVGGGTPSYLGAELLSRLITAIRSACPQLSELSFEANPDSLSDEVLVRSREAGATRVSIGVQSLVDKELRSLGRIHTAAQAITCVRAALRSGLDVSVDLMCAIPHQTDTSWAETLATVCELGVDHVSVYPLAIEEGTPFERRYADEETPWNDEEVQAERMEAAEKILLTAGLTRYEVASYARPQHACRHNISYWTGITYAGLGPGASSMLSQAQYACLRSFCPWLPAPEEGVERIRMTLSPATAECEWLTARQAWAEDLMLGMRLVNGVACDLVPQSVARDLVRRGLAKRKEARLVPTHDGWLLGNELYGTLWDLAGSEVKSTAFPVGSGCACQI